MAPFSSVCAANSKWASARRCAPLASFYLLLYSRPPLSTEHAPTRLDSAEAVLWRFPAAAFALLLIVIAVALNSAYTLLYFCRRLCIQGQVERFMERLVPAKKRIGERGIFAASQSDFLLPSLSCFLCHFSFLLSCQNASSPRCLNRFLCDDVLIGKCAKSTFCCLCTISLDPQFLQHFYMCK